MRGLVIGLTTVLCLGGCATAPTVAHDGSLSALKGQSLAPLSSQSSPADAALAASIQAGLLRRLAANGADVAGGKTPAYLLQVGVGVSAPVVGVSSVAGPSFKETTWRSAPTRRHFWSRRGPDQTATAVVLEVSTGKPVAWATVRGGRPDAEVMADRLAQALVSAAP